MNSSITSAARRIGFLLVSVLLTSDPRIAILIGQVNNEPKEISIGSVLRNGEMIKYRGYVLRKRHRRVVDSDRALAPIDVSYAVLNRKGKRLVKFDAKVYFGMGNDTRFGLVSILGRKGSKQAVISQDVPRGGAQWIITFSPRARVIFNGPRWAVGREGDDMGLVDLDGDGIYEITVPITDFYELQDKMSMSQIPLPEIIFKYDRILRRYLPANALFPHYALDGITTSTDISTDDPLQHRSIVLRTTLSLIYAGKRKAGWQYYDESYKLTDKEEIKRRVRAILVRQPVYKFIYNPRRNS